MDETDYKIGLIILAAGNSSRLGTPKQLINFHGETLLQKIVRASRKSFCHPIIAVLGENADEFNTYLENTDIQTVKNENWREGMGTSISCGIKKITGIDKDLKGIVLCVCDQPFVTTTVINRLVKTYFQEKSRIVASAYADTLGVPTLFDETLFTDLMNLQGKSGAKTVIENFLNETFPVDFPEGGFDIDTQEDLVRLQEIK